MIRKLLCLFLSVTVFGGCGSFLPKELPTIFKPITEKDEIKMSREFRREAKKHFKFISHPEVERYVNRIGRRILSVMGPQPFEYRFFTVEDRELNAFAVPGGSIYVHTGLIKRVNSTDELAGVLGHEIIHIKARHIARISGPDPLSLLALLSIFLVGSGPQGQAAGVLGQALSASQQLSYTRQLEQEADILGVKYMSEAGYDPRASLGFLKIINQEKILNPVNIPPYLLTHPLSRERIAKVEGAIRSFNLTQSRSNYPDPIRKIQLILRLEADDSENVIKKYEKLVKNHPESAEPVHLLGVAYHYKGKLAQARESYERARALSPGSIGIDRDLGRIYTQIGEFRLAHEAFKRSLIVEPREALNYLFLGELFEKESNFQDAVGGYLRARNLSPLWAEPPHHLGKVYSKMNRLGDAYYYLGRSHLLSDEDEEAIADFKRAIEIFGSASPRGQIIREEMEAIKAKMG